MQTFWKNILESLDKNNKCYHVSNHNVKIISKYQFSYNDSEHYSEVSAPWPSEALARWGWPTPGQGRM
jgi:hypothetical protein